MMSENDGTSLSDALAGLDSIPAEPTAEVDARSELEQELEKTRAARQELEQELAAIKEMREAMQLSLAKPAAEPLPAPDALPEGAHLIHFVEDGFTALETMWYRGLELVVVEGTPEWEMTLDRDGKSWLSLTDADQYKRYGRIMFREGPWQGEDWENEVKALENARRRRVPPPVVQLSR